MPRRFATVLACWLSVCSWLACGVAWAVTGPTGAPPPVVKVGLLADSPPFHVWPQPGQPSGYDIDLLNRLGQLSGIRFEYQRFQNWNQLQDALAAESIDLVTATAMTPQRQSWLRFSRHYISLPQGFAGKRQITSVSAAPDLAGRRLAVSRDDATEYIATERFPLAVRLSYDSENAALAAVAAGEADFVFAPAVSLRAAMAQRGDAGLAVLRTFGFPEGQRRLASKFGRVELIDTLDAALARLDPGEQAQWQQRWLSPWQDPEIPRLEPSENVAPLSVGYFPDEHPFSFIDRSGHAAGVSIELLKATFRHAGLEVSSFRPYPLSKGLEALRKGELDLMVGVNETAERQQYARFVGPYRNNPVALVSRNHAQVSSLDQLAGRKLMMRTAFFGAAFVRANHPTILIVGCEQMEECLDEVERGHADAVMASLEGVIDLLSVGKRRSLRVTGVVSQVQDEDCLGLALSRAHLAPRLRDALQTAIRVDQPRIEREWAQQQASSRVDWADVWVGLLWGFAVLVMAGASWFWHQRRLKRQIVKTQAARSQSEQYLAFMAHEVRNSLQSVAGATVLLRNSSVGEEHQRPLLEALDRSSRSTLGLLNDLLDRHRLHDGAMQIALRPESIEHIVGAVVEEVLPAARAKGLQLRFEPETTLAGWWQIDALRLQQVLRNLLVNAVKFSSEGTVSVRTSLQPQPRGPAWRQLIVKVIDQGPGLPPDLASKVFSGGVTQGGDRPGSGMGLSLARELVRAMGGDITVQSPAPQNVKGQGACFTVSLPVQEGRAAQPAAAGAGQRLLVLEDSLVYSLLLEEAFTHAGASVYMCDSLAKARDALIASVAGAGSTLPAFDLVVSDSHLGDGHVSELLAFLRDSVRPGVRMPPVICISAESLPAEQARLRAAGAIDLLAKDSDVTAFVHRVLAAFAAVPPVDLKP